MKIFTINYDIDGLLCALYISFTEDILPDRVENVLAFQPPISAITINIPSDNAHAQRVKSALIKYGGEDVISHLKVCLLSCDFNALTCAFNYAHYMLKMRFDVSNRLSVKCVSDFSFTVQKVLHERHTFIGFLRFRQSKNGVLFAQYSPDNDITCILAPHFLRRLGNNPFIIYDVKRKIVAISDGKHVNLFVTNLAPTFAPEQTEKELISLWRKFYNQINLKQHPRLKQQVGLFTHHYKKYCFEAFD